MPLTQLDTTAALIVIDLQKGVVGMPMVYRFCVEKIFPRLGETETTENVLKMLGV
jgi:hypothetical protein